MALLFLASQRPYYYCAQAVEAGRDWECWEQQQKLEVEVHMQVYLVVVTLEHCEQVYSEVMVQELYVVVSVVHDLEDSAVAEERYCRVYWGHHREVAVAVVVCRELVV